MKRFFCDNHNLSKTNLRVSKAQDDHKLIPMEIESSQLTIIEYNNAIVILKIYNKTSDLVMSMYGI